jgi:two-component system sensor histidine kinase CpxA
VVAAPDGVAYRMLARRTSDLVFDLWNIFLQPWVLVVLAIGISGLGCAWLALQLTRPVLRLREGVRAIAAGDLDVRMGPDLAARKDELGGLARDFDSMADDLRAHIASKEELLRDISHELRSPLARLRLASGLARDRARRDGALDRIDREVERIDQMIGQILRFSRLGSGPAPNHEPIDLAELLEECVEDAGIEADVEGKAVELELAAAPWVVGERAQLRSAIDNVLRNAVRFTPPGAATRVALRADEALAVIEIGDPGPGVAEADLPRLFEPFFRGEPSEGVGLGLAIASRIAALHGGCIEAANQAPTGLRVTLSLPLAQAPGAA